MNPAMREQAASDDHIVKCTKFGQHLAIFIHFAKSLSTHDFFVPAVVSSDFGFQVSHEYCHVLFLQCYVKVLLFLYPCHLWMRSTE